MGISAASTVTLAVPVTPPLVAVTVNGPPTVSAVNSPLAASMLPPPDTVQLTTTPAISVPYWSRPRALYCWLPPADHRRRRRRDLERRELGGAAASP